MNFLHRCRMFGVLFCLLVFCSACVESNSDEGAPAADDAGDDSSDNADDDADDLIDDDFDDSGDDVEDDSGDDSANDDTSDDDTSVDDTAADDTGDDTIDDDTTYADIWPAICEDPSPGTESCSTTMRKLYCQLGYPVIKDDVAYSQTEAISACRDGADPVWSDIVDCGQWIVYYGIGRYAVFSLFSPFVACMSYRGWPAQQTDYFDATQWEPEDYWFAILYAIQSLNFWAFAFSGPVTGEFAGAVVEPGISLRASSYTDELIGGRGWEDIYRFGDSTSYDDTAVAFQMVGWLLGYIIPYGYYYYPYVAVERLVPAAP